MNCKLHHFVHKIGWLVHDVNLKNFSWYELLLRNQITYKLNMQIKLFGILSHRHYRLESIAKRLANRTLNHIIFYSYQVSAEGHLKVFVCLSGLVCFQTISMEVVTASIETRATLGINVYYIVQSKFKQLSNLFISKLFERNFVLIKGIVSCKLTFESRKRLYLLTRSLYEGAIEQLCFCYVAHSNKHSLFIRL